MKHTYFECDCFTAEHTIRFSYFPEERDFIYAEVHLSSFGFFKRVWTALRYVFGKQSQYGCFSETMLNRGQVSKVRDTCNEFLGVDSAPEPARDIFNWMLKYDNTLAGNHKAILDLMISKGAQALYEEGLKNIDPLPEEISKAMAEAQSKALVEAMKDRPVDH